jgi:two-component system KDP operon response regulator KdpE
MERKTRILAVDDESNIRRLLKANLENKGYEVSTAMDGAEALEKVATELPDLMILDINMPKMGGFETCRQLRQWSQIPIIMLSARGDQTDKVTCLELGADDYITKPFGISELEARVKAVLRRTGTTSNIPNQPFFTSGDLQISFAERRVTMAGNEVRLTPTEYSLLQELVLNAGKALTHTYLLQKVWGPEYYSETEYLHVFIGRLRRKLHIDSADHEYILTLPGVGYQFRDTA